MAMARLRWCLLVLLAPWGEAVKTQPVQSANSSPMEVRRQPRLATFAVSDNGVADVRSVFPGASITSGYRGPNHPLSLKNPRSYHAKTHGAVDIRPIKGMTFDQYVGGLRKAGYSIVEARDEVTNPSSHATGPHWHVVLGKKRGAR